MQICKRWLLLWVRGVTQKCDRRCARVCHQVTPGSLKPYGPVYRLKAFTDNLWTVDADVFYLYPPAPLVTLRVPFNVRSHVLRLDDGSVMLLGTVKPTEQLQREVSTRRWAGRVWQCSH